MELGEAAPADTIAEMKGTPGKCISAPHHEIAVVINIAAVPSAAAIY